MADKRIASWSRRSFMTAAGGIGLAAPALLGGAGCSRILPGVGGGGPFFFIQMTDPQFGMFSGDKEFEKETALFEKAVAHANRLRPRFVVVTGDLVNKPGDPEQTAELLRIGGQLKKSIPLFWVAGNHDVENIPTPESLAAYRENVGIDWYSFGAGRTHFVVLDSCLIQQPSGAQAAARRQAEAERFAAEQARAKAAEAKRVAQQMEDKGNAAKALRDKMFGGFRRKR